LLGHIQGSLQHLVDQILVLHLETLAEATKQTSQVEATHISICSSCTSTSTSKDVIIIEVVVIILVEVVNVYDLGDYVGCTTTTANAIIHICEGRTALDKVTSWNILLLLLLLLLRSWLLLLLLIWLLVRLWLLLLLLLVWLGLLLKLKVLWQSSPKITQQLTLQQIK
jgi:hypothetical protein